MFGQAKWDVSRSDITNVFLRVMLAAVLLVHAAGQWAAFWRASLINSPGAFPEVAMFVNAAVATVIITGAVMLTVGLLIRFTSLALMLLVAVASVVDLVLFGAAGSALDWLPRFTVMFGLLVPFVTGGGSLSVDALMESRLAPCAAY
jgi:uncharacterized membrane protein YphA (DoxX/SURF4 family)